MAELPTHHRCRRGHHTAVATAFLVSTWLLALAWRPAFAPIAVDDTVALSRAWARTNPQLAEAGDCLACHRQHGSGFVHAGSRTL